MDVRNYTEATRKALFTLSLGRCYKPNCRGTSFGWPRTALRSSSCRLPDRLSYAMRGIIIGLVISGIVALGI
jgi:hypothetical protein